MGKEYEKNYVLTLNLVSSNEVIFYLIGVVNMQNYLQSKNPHWISEDHTKHSHKVNIR